jgi:hypothetical protein
MRSLTATYLKAVRSSYGKLQLVAIGMEDVQYSCCTCSSEYQKWKLTDSVEVFMALI